MSRIKNIIGFKLGKDLEVGDEIDVWWKTGVVGYDGDNVSRILELRPYEGHLKIWEPEKAMIALLTKDDGKDTEMTIEPHHRFSVYNKGAKNLMELRDLTEEDLSI